MQKSAYEMRISDWSSDVCSSDLLSLWKCRPAFSARRTGLRHAQPERLFWIRGMIQIADFYLFATIVIASAAMVILARNPVHSVMWLLLALDRKSVVLGKSVSVRVDLGGRQSIKKKKKYHT